MSLIAIALIAAFALYVMTPQERQRLVPRILRRSPAASGDPERFGLVAPAVTAVNVVVFILMAGGSGAFGDPETLVTWGGNFGPRTTNGEWSRLLISMFVHTGPLHLIATMLGLVQAGLIVERLAGYATLAAVYTLAGFFASAVSLWLHPMDVSVGASGAVLGLYGFLAASALWGIVSATGARIPLHVLKTFLPATALFLLYNVSSGALRLDAELAGCGAGFVSGLLLTRDIGERRPAAARVAVAVAATFVLAAAIAIPLYGLVDARPEIKRMVMLEDGSAAKYDAALARFRKGMISAKDLAHVIERSIVPDLQSARNRMAALGRIPREHQQLVARAKEFLTLREQSWRVRAEALEVGSMAGLRKADVMETTSLRVLATLEPPVGVLEAQ